MNAQSVTNESASDAGPMVQWIDKQSLHALFIQQHEAYRTIAIIDGEPKGGLWQKSCNFRFDVAPVGRRQEKVRRIDCRAPNLHDTPSIGSGCFSYMDHPMPV